MTPTARSRGNLGRDFWWYFGGQLTSQVGSSFTLFALPLLVFKLTHSATNLALTTAANFVPYCCGTSGPACSTSGRSRCCAASR